MRILAVASEQPAISATFAAVCPSEIMKHQSRSVVVRQAVDNPPHAAAHLIDDKLLVDLWVQDEVGFVELDHLHPALWPPKVVGGDPGGDGERPGLDAGSSFEAGQTACDLQQRLLEKVFGGGTVSDESLEVAAQRTREVFLHVFENDTGQVSAHGALAGCPPQCGGVRSSPKR